MRSQKLAAEGRHRDNEGSYQGNAELKRTEKAARAVGVDAKHLLVDAGVAAFTESEDVVGKRYVALSGDEKSCVPSIRRPVEVEVNDTVGRRGAIEELSAGAIQIEGKDGLIAARTI